MNFLEFLEHSRATGLMPVEDEGPLNGCRVRLKPAEDRPGVWEEGVIMGHDLTSGTAVIQVDARFIEGPHDDGLREFDPEEWVEVVLTDPEGKPLN